MPQDMKHCQNISFVCLVITKNFQKSINTSKTIKLCYAAMLCVYFDYTYNDQSGT